ncbi:MAG: hypothetical protein ABJM06_06540 [Gilvibacter sp.]
MDTLHPTAQSIKTKVGMFPNGSAEVTYSYNSWTIFIESIWGNRRNKIYLTATHTAHVLHKKSYSLKQTGIYRIFFMARNPNYNAMGKANKITHLLLSSVNAQNMLHAMNPSFLIKNKSINYNGKLKVHDFKSLSNSLILYECLLDEIHNQLPIN